MGAAGFSRPANWLYTDGTCHELGHTWSSSCVYTSVEFFLQVYLESFVKIYLPLFLFSNIVRRRSISSIIDSTIPAALRSSLFLAINAAGFITFICLLRRSIGRFYFYTTAFFPALIASFLAIITERKSRRAQLTGYVGAIAVETLYKMLKYRDKLKAIPYGEVMIFSLATSVLYSYYKSPKGLDDAIGTLLKVLFNPPGVLPVKLSKQIRRGGPFSSTVVPFIAHTSLVCLWGFTVGYGVQSLLSVLQLGRRILRNPVARIKQVLMKPYNRQLGAFFGALTGIFSVLNSVMYLLSVPRDIRILISGLFAGLSMLYIRSTTISLYAASKAIELVFYKAVERGYVRSSYYGDIVLYSIFTAILFHAAFFEAHNLRIGYWRFLNNISGGRIIKINYDAVDMFGTDSSQLIKLMRAQENVERRERSTVNN